MSRWLIVIPVAVLATLALAATSTARPRVPGAMQVTMNINAAGVDEVSAPDNIAVRAGGTVTLVFRNHTALFHTFTIRALGISKLIEPARHGHVTISRLTVVIPYGIYTWRCLLCPSSAHPHTHSMAGKVYAIVAA